MRNEETNSPRSERRRGLISFIDSKGQVTDNVDEVPVGTCKWTELPNVRIFYDFLKDYQDEFE